MTEQHGDFHSIQQDRPAELSAKELHAKRFQPRSLNNNNKKKVPLRLQVSKPPKTSIQLRPTVLKTHFTWALVLTIFCFFLIGPIWALYKTSRLRRMIEQQELDAAKRLSHKISTVLVFSTIVGVFLWVAILFCSAGLLLTGKLLASDAI